ncbi:lipase member J [Leptinotarsa decemlineata]|uniref:lipase member J n=1 Tax=Leptinotarsa decemlineata TaxID=7539 RepID=UPI003D30852E
MIDDTLAMILLFLLCLSMTEVWCAPARRNNVCKTFEAYANVNDDKNCYYNPDADSTPYQIAKRYGFLIEDHLVTTKDGYILTIFRLLDTQRKIQKSRQPVALQHGVLVDGVSWMISGNNSLAFYLANSGLDVWIVNSRGTPFSLKHTNPSISEKDYWNYSFHEVGIYDLPAILEEISKHTNRTDIIHIGHSMGATASTVYSILRSDHARKYLKGIIHLAPVIKFFQLRGVLALIIPFHDILVKILELLGIHAIGQFTTLQRFILKLTCSRFPLILPCKLLEAFSTGLVFEQARPEIMPLILTNFPVGLPIKTIEHYCQIYSKSGRFQFYDYGPSNNLKIYNSSDPPEYNLGDFTIPIHIFSGKQDFLAPEEDVNNFYNELNCPKTLHYLDAAHNDFAYGKNVEETYKSIVNSVKTMSTTDYGMK